MTLAVCGLELFFSFFFLNLFLKYSHYVSFTLCHPTWQLIAVKSGTKKVAITRSAGGPSEITVIPDTLDKSLGFQSMNSGHI